MKVTTADEPERLAAGVPSAAAHDAFTALTHAVRVADVKTEKDGAVYEELLGALRRAMESRDDRLAVSLTRIPRTLWSLVVFGSVLIVFGFLALGIRSLPLAAGACGAASGIITFLLSVIKDLDNPFTGVWNVSYAPLVNATSRVA